MPMKVFHLGLMGASDVQDRNHREWVRLLCEDLQTGKNYRVRHSSFGYEGMGSNGWISGGWHTKMANAACDACIIAVLADGSPALGGTPANSQSNMLTIIDALRARRNMPIFLLNSWRMPAATEAATFSQYASIRSNNTTIAGLRSNITILDNWTNWGDPSLNPSEFDAGDQIHPLIAGHKRCTIPLVKTAIASLIP